MYTPAGVVMAQFFVNLPYAVKNFSASFDMLDHNYVFIGKNLGLSNVQIFFHIVLPSLKYQAVRWLFSEEAAPVKHCCLKPLPENIAIRAALV